MDFIFPYTNFIFQHDDSKIIVGPFFDICIELWNSNNADIVDHINTIMTSVDGNIVAEFGGYDAVMRLIDMFLNGEDSYIICMSITLFVALVYLIFIFHIENKYYKISENHKKNMPHTVNS